jgi:hypothetical protein
VVLAGPPVGLDVDQHLQGHQRVAQHEGGHRAAVDVVLLLAHGLQLPHGVLEHGQGLLVEEGDVALEAVEGLGDQGHFGAPRAMTPFTAGVPD